jgi:mRNA interferase MazF
LVSARIYSDSRRHRQGDESLPALVASRDNDCRLEFVCFITSIPRTGPESAPLAGTPASGLKVPSSARFDA